MKTADIESAKMICRLCVGTPSLCGRHLRLAGVFVAITAWLLLFVSVTVSANQLPRATDARCARIDARQGYGPYDYRQRRTIDGGNAIELVESAHFRRYRRNALRGDPSKNTRPNLDYTLRAFPNHAPALYFLAVFDHKLRDARPDEFRRIEAREDYSPVSCYFERAMRFAPDDPNVHNAYGRFLTSIEEYDKAIETFKKAVQLASRSAMAHYNLGLAYYAAGKFEESSKAAREAYRLGYKRPELRDRLKRKGHW